MLSDFRFVIGGIMATTVLSVATFGLFVSVRLAHEAKVTPIGASRPLAYAEHGNWNKFYDAAGIRHDEVVPREPEEGANPSPDPFAVIGSQPLVADPMREAAPNNEPAAAATEAEARAIAATEADAITEAPAPRPDNGAPARWPEAGALVIAEARIAGSDPGAAVPSTPNENVVPAPAPTEQPAQIAMAARNAAAATPTIAETQNAGPPAIETSVADAPVVQAPIAEAPVVEAPSVGAATASPETRIIATAEPAPDETASVRLAPADERADDAEGDRIPHVSPAPSDPTTPTTAAAVQDVQQEATSPARRIRRAAPRAKHAITITRARIKPAGVRIAKPATIRIARFRSRRGRQTFVLPQASTGYAIAPLLTTPLARARPKSRGVQVGGSTYQN